jgi:hypothetical protein
MSTHQYAGQTSGRISSLVVMRAQASGETVAKEQVLVSGSIYFVYAHSA